MAITPGGRPGDASPLGKGPRRLTNYEREVAHALIRAGHDKRSAIRIARGVIDRAAATGRWGKGKAKPNVRAGAVASVAQRGALSLSTVDLAAVAGHHVPGTAYHWWHGWHPRDVRTARAAPYSVVTVDLTRHVRTAAGAARYHRPIGSPIGGEAVPSVPGVHYSSAFTDTSRAKASEAAQSAAQDKAEQWASNEGFGISGSYENKEVPPPTPESIAAELWQGYQSASLYQSVQAALREPSSGDHQKFETAAHDMFDYAGYKTKEPTTFYRAVRGSAYTDKFIPGQTYSEPGISSTTDNLNYAQGWLLQDDQGEFMYQAADSMDGKFSHYTVRPNQEDNAVLELRVPAGTTIVGGSDQFVETMLPPGTKFKIISREKRSTITARSPLNTGPTISKFTYTHIVAELVP